MRRGIWKEATECDYLQKKFTTCHIERMSYLMKEEIKSGRPSDYYNVAQSDVEDWFEEN
jgi:hypothetical protein